MEGKGDQINATGVDKSLRRKIGLLFTTTLHPNREIEAEQEAAEKLISALTPIFKRLNKDTKFPFNVYKHEYEHEDVQPGNSVATESVLEIKKLPNSESGFEVGRYDKKNSSVFVDSQAGYRPMGLSDSYWVDVTFQDGRIILGKDHDNSEPHNSRSNNLDKIARYAELAKDTI